MYILIQKQPNRKTMCSPQEYCCEKDMKFKVAAKKWL